MNFYLREFDNQQIVQSLNECNYLPNTSSNFLEPKWSHTQGTTSMCSIRKPKRNSFLIYASTQWVLNPQSQPRERERERERGINKKIKMERIFYTITQIELFKNKNNPIINKIKATGSYQRKFCKTR